MNQLLEKHPFSSLSRQLKERLPAWTGYGILLIAIWAMVPQLGIDATPPLIRYPRLALEALAYLLLGMKIFCMDDHNVRELLGICTCLLLLLIGTIVALDRWLLRFSLMLFASKGLSFRRIIKMFLWMFVLTLLWNLFTVASGLKPMVIMNRSYTGGNNRYGMGFGHPNAFALWIFMIECCILLLVRKKKQWLMYAAMLLAGFITYKLTECRAGAVVMLALIIGCVLAELLENYLNRSRWILGAMLAVTFLLPAAFIIMCILYTPESPILRAVDQLTSFRLTWARWAMDIVPFSLFGSRMQDTLTSPDGYWICVDCMYIHYLLLKGIIPCAVISVFFPKCVIRLYRQREWKALVVFAAILLYGTMEQLFLSCIFLPMYAIYADPVSDPAPIPTGNA